MMRFIDTSRAARQGQLHKCLQALVGEDIGDGADGITYWFINPNHD